MPRTLSPEHIETTITNALRVAAEQFDKDATADPMLRAPFTRQAEDSRQIADAIEANGLATYVYRNVPRD